jgi:hypothetical protein
MVKDELIGKAGGQPCQHNREHCETHSGNDHLDSWHLTWLIHAEIAP